MTQLSFLIPHDLKLSFKYKIISVSVIVTLIYMAVFKAISNYGDVHKMLVLVIFNDPALLGFLFAGVLVLFEKNENTLQALSVTPIRIENYILSKTLVLTIISVVCCMAMVIAAKGVHFNWIHFIFATFVTTFIFSMLGFVAVAGQDSFNTYILRAIALILFFTLPFLAYFELVPKIYFILFPTQSTLDFYDLAFGVNNDLMSVFKTYSFSIVWMYLSFMWAKKTLQKDFQK